MRRPFLELTHVRLILERIVTGNLMVLSDSFLGGSTPVCDILPLLSTTENLYIYEHLQSQLGWKNGIENTEWFELLLPITALNDLYLPKQLPHTSCPPYKSSLREEEQACSLPRRNLFGGVPAIGTCPGGHWAAHFCATAHQSPFRHLSMRERLKAGDVL
jgi:hypothetical protein